MAKHDMELCDREVDHSANSIDANTCPDRLIRMNPHPATKELELFFYLLEVNDAHYQYNSKYHQTNDLR